MAIVKEGQKVLILFEAKLDTGEIVLKTEDNKPLEITVGEGAIPKSIEKTLADMKEGETRTITLEPVESFGPRVNELVIDLPKQGFSSDHDLMIGSRVSLTSPDNKTYTGIIVEIKDECVTVDFNHPLAGKSLIFTVTVVSVE